MPYSLEQLKRFTVVVADSGDIETARRYKPQDATTNPSLILAATKLDAYKGLLTDAVAYARSIDRQASTALDRLIVNFGVAYLKVIPGRISTEVDARLSYDTEGTIKKAKQLISLYKDAGIGPERVLIKVAGTWEGIQAVKVLESEGIHCNVTLVFSLVQAVAAAETGATLISPFVGRISDWHTKRSGGAERAEIVDPGVASVRNIYAYFRRHGYKTIVMGASFRNVNQILDLAGIDYLTISPALLEELAALDKAVDSEAINCTGSNLPNDVRIDKVSFKTQLETDPMAFELLDDGIRRFDQDASRLEALLGDLLTA